MFYWQWGSVLAHIDQLRAPWDNPTRFDTGKAEVFGCVWEMEVVTFETRAWTSTILSDHGAPHERLKGYLEQVAT